MCVVGADGSGLRQITRVAPAGDGAGFAGAHLGPAVWSPDGALFAVAAYPERRGAASGVFVVDPQRGSSNRVSELVPSSALIWGSDGDAVVFAATSDGRSDVFQVETADGEVHNLTSSLAQPARDPALAPQGGRLAVASGGAIVVFAAGTASPDLTVRAANDLRASQPAWSADGETLAFTASADPITTYDS